MTFMPYIKKSLLWVNKIDFLFYTLYNKIMKNSKQQVTTLLPKNKKFIYPHLIFFHDFSVSLTKRVAVPKALKKENAMRSLFGDWGVPNKQIE